MSHVQVQLAQFIASSTADPRILVTGSEGLIGSRLCEVFEEVGISVMQFDIAREESQTVCDIQALIEAAQGCTGIIHLAAVSRVVWGEQDPDKCWSTNADGTRNVVDAAVAQPTAPWVIYSSSREVYGEPSVLPVDDDCPRAPVNIYGRAKSQGEAHVQEAISNKQLTGAVLRFSNVYGSVNDHADRVVPAFARAAATDGKIVVNGSANTFDFTHLEDTVAGIVGVANYVQSNAQPLGPTHFTTGKPTSLGELAALASDHAGGNVTVEDGPNRTYDVAHFHGDPRRAREQLGWEPATSIESGFAQLVDDFRNESNTIDTPVRTPAHRRSDPPRFEGRSKPQSLR